jgi:hypothetical protein
MRVRLHPDSGFNEGLFVGYDDNGDVAVQGYLEVDDDGNVRFVNILARERQDVS